MVRYRIKRMGRLPPYHDIRDLSPEDVLNKKVIGEFAEAAIQKKLGVQKDDVKKITTPQEFSYATIIPYVEDQLDWGSCVGEGCNYGLSTIVYGLSKKWTRFSVRYTYRMGRFLAGLTGDSGLWVRNGIGSLRRYGCVEQERYPYDTSQPIDEKVDPDLHPLADDFGVKGLKYYRLDYPNVSVEGMVERINRHLMQKLPVECGFYCFETIDHQDTDDSGNIPYPAENEAMVGGHCVCLTGFDKTYEIENPISGEKTKGAWEFINSWGTGWGDGGLGHLPFAYLTKRLENDPTFVLADEFYSMTKSDWVKHWDFV